MKEFQQENDRKDKIYSKWALLVLLIMIILVIKGLISMSIKQRESGEEKKLVDIKRAELQERYDVLSEKVNELKTDQGMEREIRSKFDVVKPGESVIMVVDKEVSAPIPVETSIIKKLWNGVVGVFKK
ncbi:MAG: septum formation initiator family protein [bacterium]